MDHLSASQINTFLDDPANWLVRVLFGVKSEAGAAAWRGSAIEAGLDLVLLKKASDEEALAAAMERFEQDAQGDLDDGVEKERQALPAYFANLLPFARSLPVPLARQVRVECRIDGVPMPIIGYLDYSFEDGDLDLKTTGRMPSFDENGRIKDKAEHLRQIAVYQHARKRPQRLVYTTPGKAKEPKVYEPCEEELSQALAEVRVAARAMCRLLESSRDPLDICAMYPPRNINGFRWDDASRAKAMEVWFN